MQSYSLDSGINCEEASGEKVQYYRLGTTERYRQDQAWELAKKKIAKRRECEEAAKKCPFSPCVSVSQKTDASVNSHYDPSIALTHDTWRVTAPVFDRLQQTRSKQKAVDGTPVPVLRPPKNSDVVSKSAIPVEDRLLQYGDHIAFKLAEKRLEEEKLSVPIVHSPRKNSSQRREEQHDFFTRNMLLLEKRKAKRFETEKDLSECTFHPKVNIQSAALDINRREKLSKTVCSPPSGLGISPSVPDDTISDSAIRQEKDRSTMLYEEAYRKRVEEKENVQLHSCDFVPRTNPLSKEWIDRSNHYHSLFQMNFLERQELYKKESDEYKSVLEAQQLDSQKTPTFYIPDDKEQRKQYCAALEEQIDRLYKGKVTSSSNSHSSDDISGSTFRPQIAPGSQLVIQKMKDREADVVKRLTKTAKKQCADENRVEEESCSGNRISKAEAENFYRRQMRALQRKEFHVAEEKKMEEVRSVLECTFRPTLSPRLSIPTRDSLSNQVIGVSKFLQRQADAKRLQKEKEEREKRIGSGIPVNGPNHTILTPFKLETDHRSRGKDKSVGLCFPHRQPEEETNNFCWTENRWFHSGDQLSSCTASDPGFHSTCEGYPTLSLFSAKMDS